MVERRLFAEEALGGLFHPRPAPAPAVTPPEPPAVEDAEARDRALLEQLIAATRLYDNGPAVKELLAFTIRLRAFAPFNAMILHIQKPGLTHAATAADWWQRFGRVPKAGTRPLLVLRAMGPVDFVFDVLDTEGRAIPEHAFTFPTLGTVSQDRFEAILASLAKAGIELVPLDRGDGEAGWVRRHGTPTTPRARQRYQLGLNRNHPLPTQLVTIAHELAHVFLGHLGADKARDVRDRRDRGYAEQEVEAEMTAYLVARRNGLTPRSESYLDAYKGAFTGLDLYGVMRAANMVEAAMGVAAHQLRPTAETELAA